ncbi:MAG: UDP-N-acetylmuramoyl-L-alanyl-D-glutamate--2,6-diaminopimelate ligase [Ruminococcaceae bacterium]|nr:UDP-N-acetylmuramoyl-L-alanyl-D-glutamate--2,6-diaminopimelate ligase [Oscillospiraceae bacterium]
MKLCKLLNGIEYKAHSMPSSEIEITDICSDSRKVTKGCAFVCLRGTASDGHDFAEKAYKDGAAVIIAEQKLGFDCPLIEVNDSRIAISKMASNMYDCPTAKFKLVGVTGTNGKTSTTLMIKQILEQFGFKTGVIGTTGVYIDDVQQELKSASTTPEPVELQRIFAKMAESGAEYVVMEVSSHALDQHRVDGAIFDCGIFTNLTQDHLDYHKTMENYLCSKQRLFTMCKKSIFNMDDEASKVMWERTGVDPITFSAQSNDATVLAKNIRLKPASVEFEVISGNDIGRAEVQIPGKFTVSNVMAAITFVLSEGLPLDKVLKAVKNIKGIKGRVEVVDVDTDYTVIIDYAHAPDGLENVLSSIRQTKTAGRLIVVFGCGGDRDKTKRPIMGRIAAALADYVVVTSDNPRTEDPKAIIKDITAGMRGTKTPKKVIENRREAIAYALSIAEKDDIVLLAGKGHETYQILNSGTIHFDEREVVREILGK